MRRMRKNMTPKNKAENIILFERKKAIHEAVYGSIREMETEVPSLISQIHSTFVELYGIVLDAAAEAINRESDTGYIQVHDFPSECFMFPFCGYFHRIIDEILQGLHELSYSQGIRNRIIRITGFRIDGNPAGIFYHSSRDTWRFIPEDQSEYGMITCPPTMPNEIFDEIMSAMLQGKMEILTGCMRNTPIELMNIISQTCRTKYLYFMIDPMLHQWKDGVNEIYLSYINASMTAENYFFHDRQNAGVYRWIYRWYDRYRT